MNGVTFYKNGNDIITLKNNLGQYFFFSNRIYKFLYGTEYDSYEDLDKIYGKILEKDDFVELEEVCKIKEIYSYLNSYKHAIDEFVKSNEKSIGNIREKSLSLRQS